MKYIVILFLGIFINANLMANNDGGIKCKIHLRFNSKEAIGHKVKIEYKYEEDEKNTVIDFSRVTKDTTVNIVLKEPVLGNVLVYDSARIISMTNVMILKNETVIINIYPELSKVESPENTFYHRHFWNYLELPGRIVIDKDFNKELSKSSYELSIKNNIQLFLRWKEYEKDFIDQAIKNKMLYANLYKINKNREYVSVKTLDSILPFISPYYKYTTLYKNLSSYIETTKKLFIGNVITKFSLLDSLGKKITSDEILGNGKFNLVIFWASWCVPCKKEISELSAIKNDIDSSLFNIILINLDEEKEKWHIDKNKFIESWKYYFDPKAFKSEIGKIFNLSYIPFNIIIKENKIIEKGVNMEVIKKYISIKK